MHFVLARTACVPLRREGIALRAVGERVIVDGKTIANTQFGIFVNGARGAAIRNNLVVNTDLGSAIKVQGMTQSVVVANRANHVAVSAETVQNAEGCGINSVPGAGNDRNSYADNVVTDAWCGIYYGKTDFVVSGTYRNTAYSTLNSDLPPDALPAFSAIQW